jgi:hypothetical protein
MVSIPPIYSVFFITTDEIVLRANCNILVCLMILIFFSSLMYVHVQSRL